MTDVSRTDRDAMDGDPTAEAGSRRTSVDTAHHPTGVRRPAYAAGSPPAAASAHGRGPRRARLTVRRIDPWSALKFSAVLAVALLIVWIVAVTALYAVLASMGVFDSVNQFLDELTGGKFLITLTASKVIGWAAILGVVNGILFIALSTLGAFIYNLCSSLAGGLEVTLAERE